MRCLTYQKPHWTGKLRDTVQKESNKKSNRKYYLKNQERIKQYYRQWYYDHKKGGENK